MLLLLVRASRKKIPLIKTGDDDGKGAWGSYIHMALFPSDLRSGSLYRLLIEGVFFRIGDVFLRILTLFYYFPP
jgi:hypothetical protein